jgi:predicted acyltransferase
MSKSEPQPYSSTRVHSIDALRGFDMFWIMGGDVLAIATCKYANWSFSPTLSAQFKHVEWEGFRFYDLIFPLFLFLVGCVIPYSLAKYRETPSAAYGRIVRRAALLVFLGLLYNSLLQFDWPNLRFAGVLQRIGICYLAAAIIYVQNPIRGQALWAAGLLVGYWLLLAFMPMPGGLTGDFSKEGNLPGFIDRMLLPGKIYPTYYGYGDNEGLLSTIPAIATALIGVLTGNWLKSSARPWTKVAGLLIAGVVALVVGFGWGQIFPIIKNIWTSSYVLVAAGWSLLLLALFYTVIDVLGWRRWSFFFVVIGMNAITIYFAQRVIDFQKIAQFFLGGIVSLSGDLGPIITLVGVITAKWLFLWFLYRQKLFLRV